VVVRENKFSEKSFASSVKFY